MGYWHCILDQIKGQKLLLTYYGINYSNSKTGALIGLGILTFEKDLKKARTLDCKAGLNCRINKPQNDVEIEIDRSRLDKFSIYDKNDIPWLTKEEKFWKQIGWYGIVSDDRIDE